MIDRLATLIATGCYLSYIPVKLLAACRPAARDERWTGAGFVGTLLGLAALRAIPEQAPGCLIAIIAAIGGASWASGVAERVFNRKDDSRIIIDEVVGYWVAAAFLPRTPAALAAAFVLFRFFDSVKLPPYRMLERLPGGFGVVMDDVGAGIVANLLVRALLRLI